jgi:hypothetical protein
MSHPGIALALASVLTVDGAIHLYWATGRTWPAADTRTLSRAVLNAEVPFTPRTLLPLAVLLGSAAALVLARGGVLSLPVPPTLLRWATGAVTAGLLIRGAAGLVWITGRGADPRLVFYRLNLLLYTPLCLIGAVGGWLLI